MRWGAAIALVQLLAVLSTALLTAASAVYWRSRGMPPNDKSEAPFVYWDVQDDAIVFWGVSTTGFGMRQVEVMGTGTDVRERPPPKLPRRGMPNWVVVSEKARYCDMDVEGYGWPCTTLWTAQVHRFDQWRPLRIGLTTIGYKGGSISIPTMIYWPGVVANVLTAAVCWCATFLMMVKFRAWLRVRAGRCVKCSYDIRSLHGNLCPECGTAFSRPNRPENTTSA